MFFAVMQQCAHAGRGRCPSTQSLLELCVPTFDVSMELLLGVQIVQTFENFSQNDRDIFLGYRPWFEEV